MEVEYKQYVSRLLFTSNELQMKFSVSSLERSPQAQATALSLHLLRIVAIIANPLLSLPFVELGNVHALRHLFLKMEFSMNEELLPELSRSQANARNDDLEHFVRQGVQMIHELDQETLRKVEKIEQNTSNIDAQVQAAVNHSMNDAIIQIQQQLLPDVSGSEQSRASRLSTQITARLPLPKVVRGSTRPDGASSTSAWRSDDDRVVRMQLEQAKQEIQRLNEVVQQLDNANKQHERDAERQIAKLCDQAARAEEAQGTFEEERQQLKAIVSVDQETQPFQDFGRYEQIIVYLGLMLAS